MTLTAEEQEEHDGLIRANQALTQALVSIRTRIAVFNEKILGEQPEYRIALRPDDRDANPLSDGVQMDDIVVNNVPCFRAEDMGDYWWVACYLDDDTHDRICWSVRAVRKGVIEWIVTEFPQEQNYEHLR